jgi:hypothetical protein
LETEAAPLRTTPFHHKIVSLHVPYGAMPRSETGSIPRARALFIPRRPPTSGKPTCQPDPPASARAPTKPFLRIDEIFLKPTAAYQVGNKGRDRRKDEFDGRGSCSNSWIV